jgi:hypothetical protein
MFLQVGRSISLVACLLVVSVAHGSDALDPCAQRSDIADATVTLESARLEPSGIFVGVFRIESHARDATRHFRGFIVSGEMRIVAPERSIEYLDGIANEWRHVLDLPGTFPPRPEDFVLLPGKALRFAAPLFTSEVETEAHAYFAYWFDPLIRGSASCQHPSRRTLCRRE